MSTTTISLLIVLGLSAGLGNPIGLGDGPHGIPSDFTLSKVQERIHFRGEGKIIKGWKWYGVVCVSWVRRIFMRKFYYFPFLPLFQDMYMRRLGSPICSFKYLYGFILSNIAWLAQPSTIWWNWRMKIMD